MDHREGATPPLLIRPRPPKAERIDTKKFVLVVGVLGFALVVLFAVKLQGKFARAQGVHPAPLPSVHDVQGAGTLDQVLKVPSSYAGLDRRPTLPPPPPKEAVPPQMAALPPPPTVQAPPALPAGAPSAPAPTPVATPPSPAPPPAPKRWLFADVHGTVGKPPFPAPPAARAEGEQARDGTDTGEPLIRHARRDRPLDPMRVLYRSQVITGMLLHEINSDIPGQVRIMVTRPVTDKFHQGQVLIPQGSILLGVQEKTPTFGQNRLAVTIEEVHAPDGEVIALPGQLADRSGATGARGKVNNHYGKIGVAAVVSAALNIGARGLAGNPTGYQPTIAHELARETGESISRTGQSIVERTLNVPPSITLKAGTAVTIHLSENLSLQHSPTVGK